MKRFCLALALALAALPGTIMAQNDPVPGPASPTDFDFLEGSWTVVYNNSQRGIPPNVPGTWIGRKESDGRVLFDEFRLQGPDGRTATLGATYRVFDHVRSRWDMRYVGLIVVTPDGATTQPAQWAELTAWREGNTMRVDQRGRSRMLRITYYNISRNRFSWKADVSTDGGQTWVRDQIRIEATRSP